MTERTGQRRRDMLTIDQVASTVGMSARNVRAHQSRGLIPPPEIRGRVAMYDGEHVERLRLVQDLQELGFSLAAIEQVFAYPASYGAVLARLRAGKPAVGPAPTDTDHRLHALGLGPDGLSRVKREIFGAARRVAAQLNGELRGTSVARSAVAPEAADALTAAFEVAVVDALRDPALRETASSSR